MPRSLYKQGVRHPLNPVNSEFSHSLGRKRTFTHSWLTFLELLTKALMEKRFQIIGSFS